MAQAAVSEVLLAPAALRGTSPIPGIPVLELDGQRTRLTPLKLGRLFSPDGLSLPGTGTDPTASATSLSAFGLFSRQNNDLLRIIDQDPDLLAKATQAGFEDRSDLLGILSQHVRDALPVDTPLTERFLSENPEVTSILALNLGGIRDTLAQDSTLASSLTEGQTLQVALTRKLAQTAADGTRGRGGLDEAFFTARPVAAAYLLNNPSQLEAIGADTTGTQAARFIQRVSLDNRSLESFVADKARSLLHNVTGYPDAYLQADSSFTALLAGAPKLSDHQTFTAFLASRPELTLGGVDPGGLLRAFEVDLAQQRISAANPEAGRILDRTFLDRNAGLAMVFNEFPQVRQAVLDDLPRLTALETQARSSASALSHDAELFAAFSKAGKTGTLSFFF